MNSAICTLFEGHYHQGVGALANSLYAHGFRGTIYVGYRGPLPPWVTAKGGRTDRDQKSEVSGPRADAKAEIGKAEIRNGKPGGGELAERWTDYTPAEGLMLRFIPLATKAHLTNYKPDFMLDVWGKHCPQAEAMFYFDPDIVIKCGWSYIEFWAQAGVALCEDVNSPIVASHPLRAQWRRIYEQHGINLDFKTDIYVNGGFQGLAKVYRRFLEDWRKIQGIMQSEIGGLEKTGRDLGGREHPFSKTDQDALNITLGMTSQPYSLMGKEGMDIAPGGFTMSHTIGSYKKAWNTNFILEALKGFPPSLAAKTFFDYVRQPIPVLDRIALARKTGALRLAALIGRFYRRI